jgi:hypothetical protein
MFNCSNQIKLKIIIKKFLFTFLAFGGLLFPLFAQIDHDYNANDRVPGAGTIIKKEQVPPEVLKAAQNKFDPNNSATWSKFPYALKEYGWVYDVGASDLKLDRYEVTMKTSNGDELWAVYTSKGELVETKEIVNNVAPSANVLAELAKSKYNGWSIVGDKEIIRFYHDHNNSNVEQHFRITVQKDNVKRTISFNFQGAN